MGDRVILHVDMNNFYASVECAERPELKSRPVAVCGDTEMRHGIVLAKNIPAKQCGVKTGDTVNEARAKCPELVLIPPHMEKYIEISRKARAIYCSYTDKVESFGIDECWLDVTGGSRLEGENYGKTIAEKIREKVKRELGLTVSVGVSYNKMFAKMGSDYKKPDAVTEITRENFKDLLWHLPARDLMFVGGSSERKFKYAGLETIGDIASCDRGFLVSYLGKGGGYLWDIANGEDKSPVMYSYESYPVKSIGNSTTPPRDLLNGQDVKIVLSSLCDTVSERMRAVGKRATVVKLSMRGTDLKWRERQCTVKAFCSDRELYDTAVRLFEANYDGERLRSIGVSVTGLIDSERERAIQLTLFDDEDSLRDKHETLSFTVDGIRKIYGKNSLKRGIQLEDKKLWRTETSSLSFMGNRGQ